MNLLLNILWIILGGLLVCLEYIVGSVLLMITIIGIPFGLQSLKLALLALCPFGQRVVSTPSDGGCSDEYTLDFLRGNLDCPDSSGLWCIALYYSDWNTFWHAAF